jgi:(2Fe-2S) ferredoxin
VAQVRVSDCLDACERSNVVVVTPSTRGRAAGARPAWLGDVLDEDTAEAIVEWVAAGGPGVSDPPVVAELSLFAPSRRVRAGVQA